MAMAARKLHMSDQPDRVFDSLDALMAEMANGARIGAGAMLQTTPEAGQWAELERNLERWIGQQSGLDAAALDALSTALLRRVQAALAGQAEGPERQRAFSACIGTIDDARSSMLTFAPADTVARHVHAVLVWYGAWHLIGAGVSVAQARAIIADTSPERRTGGLFDRPRRAEPMRPTTSIEADDRLDRAEGLGSGGLTLEPLRVPAASGPMGGLQGGMHRIVSIVTRVAAGARTISSRVQQRLIAQSEARYNARQAARRTQAEERQRRALEVARKEEALAKAVEQWRQEASTAPTNGLPVNGPRLLRSVFGTWVMLVVFSWVSLFWGALLSLPFGVGIGLLSTFAGGIIAVPLWATFWGFLGMGNARDATLRQMKFEPLPDAHAVRSTCAHYCRQLEISVPQLGTIPVHNAFAMGVDQRDATVALGRPLLSSLTPEEVNAVLAHELGHIVSGDMRRMMLMRTFQNAMVWYAGHQELKQAVRWILNWAAELAIKAFSREREYWADAIGAALAGKEAMISALRRLDDGPALTEDEVIHGRFMFRGKWHSTHPCTADRIRALEAETYIRQLPLKGPTGTASSTAT